MATCSDKYKFQCDHYFTRKSNLLEEDLYQYSNGEGKINVES